MDNRPTDEQARHRWSLIQAARAGGVILAILGLLIAEDIVSAPRWAGYLSLAAGLVGVFLVPRMLARKWRTPPQ